MIRCMCCNPGSSQSLCLSCRIFCPNPSYDPVGYYEKVFFNLLISTNHSVRERLEDLGLHPIEHRDPDDRRRALAILQEDKQNNWMFRQASSDDD